MAKTYNKKSKEDKEKEVNELLEKANEGIKKCLNTPEQFKELANYMSNFYNYSLRNAFLIQEQFKGAFAVGSYSFWKDKGFAVNKGEKGIKILVPNKLSDYFTNLKGEEVKVSKATTSEKKLIEQGMIEVKKGKVVFNQGYVFEVTQTNAKAEDLPKIFPGRWLDGEVKNYDLMYKSMENIANKIGVKIIEPKNELGAVKGVSYPLTKEVALNPRNTQLQNVKTLIHELAHAKLHTMERRDNYTKNAKEFQAEMVAYVVCSYFGLDTSEYSFRYISSWTKDVDLKDKEKLVNEVRETTKDYIEVIEKTLITDKELSLSVESENRLEKNEDIEYDKILYDIREEETMREQEKIGLTENDFVNIVLPKGISTEELFNIINVSYAETMNLSKEELMDRQEILKEIIEVNDIKVTSNEKNIEYLIAITEHNYNYTLERIDLQQSYNEWRDLVGRENWCKLQLANEDIILKNTESDKEDVRKEFSIYAKLDSIITVDEMLELENIYEEKLFQNLANIDKLEEEKYQVDKSKEYETLFDLELRDGSFIKKGTSFLIEGFKDGKYEVHFSAEKDNIYVPDDGSGDMYYFDEFEIEKFTDLSKGTVLFKEQGELEFEFMKNNIQKLMSINYGDFIKGIISIEKGINELEILDKVYEKYMDSDYNLLNDEISNSINKEKEKNVVKENEVVSIDKEKEIWKKIREHEEWINSKGTRGKQLNLENENLKGMRLINLDLRESNFRNADVSQCIIFADLRGADFTGAKIDNTRWIGSNMKSITIEANKLNLIEYQIEQESDKHKRDNKKLKTNKKEMELER